MVPLPDGARQLMQKGNEANHGGGGCCHLSPKLDFREKYSMVHISQGGFRYSVAAGRDHKTHTFCLILTERILSAEDKGGCDVNTCEFVYREIVSLNTSLISCPPYSGLAPEHF